MERIEFINIYNRMMYNELSVNDILSVIREHCIISGKDETLTKDFITFLGNHLQFVDGLFTYSIDSLSRHFNINKVIELQTNRVLLIF